MAININVYLKNIESDIDKLKERGASDEVIILSSRIKSLIKAVDDLNTSINNKLGVISKTGFEAETIKNTAEDLNILGKVINALQLAIDALVEKGKSEPDKSLVVVEHTAKVAREAAVESKIVKPPKSTAPINVGDTASAIREVFKIAKEGIKEGVLQVNNELKRNVSIDKPTIISGQNEDIQKSTAAINSVIAAYKPYTIQPVRGVKKELELTLGSRSDALVKQTEKHINNLNNSLYDLQLTIMRETKKALKSFGGKAEIMSVSGRALPFELAKGGREWEMQIVNVKKLRDALQSEMDKGNLKINLNLRAEKLREGFKTSYIQKKIEQASTTPIKMTEDIDRWIASLQTIPSGNKDIESLRTAFKKGIIQSVSQAGLGEEKLKAIYKEFVLPEQAMREFKKSFVKSITIPAMRVSPQGTVGFETSTGSGKTAAQLGILKTGMERLLTEINSLGFAEEYKGFKRDVEALPLRPDVKKYGQSEKDFFDQIAEANALAEKMIKFIKEQSGKKFGLGEIGGSGSELIKQGYKRAIAYRATERITDKEYAKKVAKEYLTMDSSLQELESTAKNVGVSFFDVAKALNTIEFKDFYKSLATLYSKGIQEKLYGVSNLEYSNRAFREISKIKENLMAYMPQIPAGEPKRASYNEQVVALATRGFVDKVEGAFGSGGAPTVVTKILSPEEKKQHIIDINLLSREIDNMNKAIGDSAADSVRLYTNTISDAASAAFRELEGNKYVLTFGRNEIREQAPFKEYASAARQQSYVSAAHTGVGFERPTVVSKTEEAYIRAGKYGTFGAGEKGFRPSETGAGGYGHIPIVQLLNTAGTFEDQILVDAGSKIANAFVEIVKPVLYPGVDLERSIKPIEDGFKNITEEAKNYPKLLESEIGTKDFTNAVKQVSKRIQDVMGVETMYEGRADIARLEKEVASVVKESAGRTIETQAAKITEVFLNYFGRKFATRAGTKGVSITTKEVPANIEVIKRMLIESGGKELRFTEGRGSLGYVTRMKDMGQLAAEIIENAFSDEDSKQLANQLRESGNKFIVSLFTDASKGLVIGYEAKKNMELQEKAFAALRKAGVVDIAQDVAGIEALKKKYKEIFSKDIYEDVPVDVRISSRGMAKRGLMPEVMTSMTQQLAGWGLKDRTILSDVPQNVLSMTEKSRKEMQLIHEALGYKPFKDEARLEKSLRFIKKDITSKELQNLKNWEAQFSVYLDSVNEYGERLQTITSPMFLQDIDPMQKYKEKPLEEVRKGIIKLNPQSLAAYFTQFGKGSEILKDILKNSTDTSRESWEAIKAFVLVQSEQQEKLKDALSKLKIVKLKDLGLGAFEERTDVPENIKGGLFDISAYPSAFRVDVPASISKEGPTPELKTKSMYVPGAALRQTYVDPLTGEQALTDVGRALSTYLKKAEELQKLSESGVGGIQDVEGAKKSIENAIFSLEKRARKMTKESFKKEVLPLMRVIYRIPEVEGKKGATVGLELNEMLEKNKPNVVVMRRIRDIMMGTQSGVSVKNVEVYKKMLDEITSLEGPQGMGTRPETREALKKIELAEFGKERIRFTEKKPTGGYAVGYGRKGVRGYLTAALEQEQQKVGYKGLLSKDLSMEAITPFVNALRVEIATSVSKGIEDGLKKLRQFEQQYYEVLGSKIFGKKGGIESTFYSRKVPNSVATRATVGIADKIDDFENAITVLSKISGLENIVSDLEKIKVEHAKKLELAKQRGIPVLKEREVGISEYLARKIRLRDEEGKEMTLAQHMRQKKTTPVSTVRFPFTGAHSIQGFYGKLLENSLTGPSKYSITVPGAPELDMVALKDVSDKLLKEIIPKKVERREELWKKADKAETVEEQKKAAFAAHKLTKEIELLIGALQSIVPKYHSMEQKLDFDGDTIYLHTGTVKKARDEIEQQIGMMDANVEKLTSVRSLFNTMFTEYKEGTGQTLAEQAIIFGKKHPEEKGFRFLEQPYLKEQVENIKDVKKVIEGLYSYVEDRPVEEKYGGKDTEAYKAAVVKHRKAFEDALMKEVDIEAQRKIGTAKDPEAYKKFKETLLREKLYEKRLGDVIQGQLYKLDTGFTVEGMRRLAHVTEFETGFGAGIAGTGKEKVGPSAEFLKRWPKESKVFAGKPVEEFQTRVQELTRFVIQKGMDVKHAGTKSVATEVFSRIGKLGGAEELYEYMQKNKEQFDELLDFDEQIAQSVRLRLGALSTREVAEELNRFLKGAGERLVDVSGDFDRESLIKKVVEKVNLKATLEEMFRQILRQAIEGLTTQTMSQLKELDVFSEPYAKLKKSIGFTEADVENPVEMRKKVEAYARKVVTGEAMGEEGINIITHIVEPKSPLYKLRTSTVGGVGDVAMSRLSSRSSVRVPTPNLAEAGKAAYITQKAIQQAYEGSSRGIGGDIVRSTIENRLEEIKLLKEILKTAETSGTLKIRGTGVTLPSSKFAKNLWETIENKALLSGGDFPSSETSPDEAIHNAIVRYKRQIREAKSMMKELSESVGMPSMKSKEIESLFAEKVENDVNIKEAMENIEKAAKASESVILRRGGTEEEARRYSQAITELYENTLKFFVGLNEQIERMKAVSGDVSFEEAYIEKLVGGSVGGNVPPKKPFSDVLKGTGKGAINKLKEYISTIKSLENIEFDFSGLTIGSADELKRIYDIIQIVARTAEKIPTGKLKVKATSEAELRKSLGMRVEDSGLVRGTYTVSAPMEQGELKFNKRLITNPSEFKSAFETFGGPKKPGGLPTVAGDLEFPAKSTIQHEMFHHLYDVLEKYSETENDKITRTFDKLKKVYARVVAEKDRAAAPSVYGLQSKEEMFAEAGVEYMGMDNEKAASETVKLMAELMKVIKNGRQQLNSFIKETIAVAKQRAKNVKNRSVAVIKQDALGYGADIIRGMGSKEKTAELIGRRARATIDRIAYEAGHEAAGGVREVGANYKKRMWGNKSFASMSPSGADWPPVESYEETDFGGYEDDVAYRQSIEEWKAYQDAVDTVRSQRPLEGGVPPLFREAKKKAINAPAYTAEQLLVMQKELNRISSAMTGGVNIMKDVPMYKLFRASALQRGGGYVNYGVKNKPSSLEAILRSMLIGTKRSALLEGTAHRGSAIHEEIQREYQEKYGAQVEGVVEDMINNITGHYDILYEKQGVPTIGDIKTVYSRKHFNEFKNIEKQIAGGKFTDLREYIASKSDEERATDVVLRKLQDYIGQVNFYLGNLQQGYKDVTKVRGVGEKKTYGAIIPPKKIQGEIIAVSQHDPSKRAVLPIGGFDAKEYAEAIADVEKARKIVDSILAASSAEEVREILKNFPEVLKKFKDMDLSPASIKENLPKTASLENIKKAAERATAYQQSKDFITDMEKYAQYSKDYLELIDYWIAQKVDLGKTLEEIIKTSAPGIGGASAFSGGVPSGGTPPGGAGGGGFDDDDELKDKMKALMKTISEKSSEEAISEKMELISLMNEIMDNVEYFSKERYAEYSELLREAVSVMGGPKAVDSIRKLRASVEKATQPKGGVIPEFKYGGGVQPKYTNLDAPETIHQNLLAMYQRAAEYWQFDETRFDTDIQDLLERAEKEGPKIDITSSIKQALDARGKERGRLLIPVWKQYRNAINKFFINRLDVIQEQIVKAEEAGATGAVATLHSKYKVALKRWKKYIETALPKKTDIYTTSKKEFISPDIARAVGLYKTPEQLEGLQRQELPEYLAPVFSRIVEDLDLTNIDSMRSSIDKVRGAFEELSQVDPEFRRIARDADLFRRKGTEVVDAWDVKPLIKDITVLRSALEAYNSFRIEGAFMESEGYTEAMRKNVEMTIAMFKRMENELYKSQGSIMELMSVPKELGYEQQVEIHKRNLAKIKQYFSKTAKEGGAAVGQAFNYKERIVDPTGQIIKNVIHQFKKVRDAEDKGIFKIKTEDMIKSWQGRKGLSQAFRRVALWGTASTVVWKSVAAFKSMVDTITQVEIKMADLRQVMNPLTTDFSVMQASAVKFAEDYGQSVDKILAGMRIFAQQGLAQADVLDRTRTAAIAANVTTLNATDATEALTAAMRVYGREGEDSVRFLDAWSQVEARHAITSGNLANALKKAGAAAKTAGFTFDEFNAVVTGIGETTRQTGKEIGTSMRFIARRIFAKKGTEALSAFGIPTTTETGEIRKGFDIFSELADRWNTLTNAQKLNIAIALGGRRHYNSIIVMMENWKDVISTLTDSINSKGAAERRNAIVMETYGKKIEQLKVAMTDLQLEFGKVALPFAKSTVDALRFLVKTIADVPTSVKVAFTAFAGFFTLLAKGQGVFDTFSKGFSNMGSGINDFLASGLKDIRVGIYETFGKAVGGVDTEGLVTLTEAMGISDLESNFGQLSYVFAKYGREFNQFLADLILSGVSASSVLGGVFDSLANKLAYGTKYFIQKGQAQAAAATAVAALGSKKTADKTEDFAKFLGVGAEKVSHWASPKSSFIKSVAPTIVATAAMVPVLKAMYGGWKRLTFSAEEYAKSMEPVRRSNTEELAQLKDLSSFIKDYAKSIDDLRGTLHDPLVAEFQIQRGQYESPLLDAKEYVKEATIKTNQLAASFPDIIEGFDKYGNVILKANKSLEEHVKLLKNIKIRDILEDELDVIDKYVQDLTDVGIAEGLKADLKMLMKEIPGLSMFAEKIKVAPAKELEMVMDDLKKLQMFKVKNPFAPIEDSMKNHMKELLNVQRRYRETYKQVRASLDSLSTEGLDETSIQALFNEEALNKLYEVVVDFEIKPFLRMSKDKLGFDLGNITPEDIRGAEILKRVTSDVTASYIGFTGALTKERLRAAQVMEREGKAFNKDVVIFNKERADALDIAAAQGIVEITDDDAFIKVIKRTSGVIQRLKWDDQDVQNAVDAVFPVNEVRELLEDRLESLQDYLVGAASGLTSIMDQKIFKKDVGLGVRFFSQLPTEMLIQTKIGYNPVTGSYGEVRYKEDFPKMFDKFIKSVEHLKSLYEPAVAIEETAAAGGEARLTPGRAADIKRAEILVKNNQVALQFAATMEDFSKNMEESNRTLQKSIEVEKERAKFVLQTTGLLVGLPKQIQEIDFGKTERAQLSDQERLLYREKSLPVKQRRFTQLTEEYRILELRRQAVDAQRAAAIEMKTSLETLSTMYGPKGFDQILSGEQLKTYMQLVPVVGTEQALGITIQKDSLTELKGIRKVLEDQSIQNKSLDVIKNELSNMTKGIASMTPDKLVNIMQELSIMRGKYIKSGRDDAAIAITNKINTAFSSMVDKIGLKKAFEKLEVGFPKIAGGVGSRGYLFTDPVKIIMEYVKNEVGGSKGFLAEYAKREKAIAEIERQTTYTSNMLRNIGIGAVVGTAVRAPLSGISMGYVYSLLENDIKKRQAVAKRERLAKEAGIPITPLATSPIEGLGSRIKRAAPMPFGPNPVPFWDIRNIYKNVQGKPMDFGTYKRVIGGPDMKKVVSLLQSPAPDLKMGKAVSKALGFGFGFMDNLRRSVGRQLASIEVDIYRQQKKRADLIAAYREKGGDEGAIKKAVAEIDVEVNKLKERKEKVSDIYRERLITELGGATALFAKAVAQRHAPGLEKYLDSMISGGMTAVASAYIASVVEKKSVPEVYSDMFDELKKVKEAGIEAGVGAKEKYKEKYPEAGKKLEEAIDAVKKYTAKTKEGFEDIRAQAKRDVFAARLETSGMDADRLLEIMKKGRKEAENQLSEDQKQTLEQQRQTLLLASIDDVVRRIEGDLVKDEVSSTQEKSRKVMGAVLPSVEEDLAKKDRFKQLGIDIKSKVYAASERDVAKRGLLDIFMDVAAPTLGLAVSGYMFETGKLDKELSDLDGKAKQLRVIFEDMIKTPEGMAILEDIVKLKKVSEQQAVGVKKGVTKIEDNEAIAIGDLQDKIVSGLNDFMSRLSNMSFDLDTRSAEIAAEAMQYKVTDQVLQNIVDLYDSITMGVAELRFNLDYATAVTGPMKGLGNFPERQLPTPLHALSSTQRMWRMANKDDGVEFLRSWLMVEQKALITRQKTQEVIRATQSKIIENAKQRVELERHIGITGMKAASAIKKVEMRAVDYSSERKKREKEIQNALIEAPISVDVWPKVKVSSGIEAYEKVFTPTRFIEQRGGIASKEFKELSDTLKKFKYTKFENLPQENRNVEYVKQRTIEEFKAAAVSAEDVMSNLNFMLRFGMTKATAQERLGRERLSSKAQKAVLPLSDEDIWANFIVAQKNAADGSMEYVKKLALMARQYETLTDTGDKLVKTLRYQEEQERKAEEAARALGDALNFVQTITDLIGEVDRLTVSFKTSRDAAKWSTEAFDKMLGGKHPEARVTPTIEAIRGAKEAGLSEREITMMDKYQLAKYSKTGQIDTATGVYYKWTEKDQKLQDTQRAIDAQMAMQAKEDAKLNEQRNYIQNLLNAAIEARTRLEFTGGAAAKEGVPRLLNIEEDLKRRLETMAQIQGDYYKGPGDLNSIRQELVNFVRTVKSTEMGKRATEYAESMKGPLMDSSQRIVDAILVSTSATIRAMLAIQTAVVESKKLSPEEILEMAFKSQKEDADIFASYLPDLFVNFDKNKVTKEQIEQAIKGKDMLTKGLDKTKGITSSFERGANEFAEAVTMFAQAVRVISGNIPAPPAPSTNKASGGVIKGAGGPTSDSVPIMASAGEFVIKTAAARRIGYDTLNYMNNTGNTKGMADVTPVLVSNGEFIFNRGAASSIGYGNLAYMNKTGKLPGFYSGGVVEINTKGLSIPVSIGDAFVPAKLQGGGAIDESKEVSILDTIASGKGFGALSKALQERIGIISQERGLYTEKITDALANLTMPYELKEAYKDKGFFGKVGQFFSDNLKIGAGVATSGVLSGGEIAAKFVKSMVDTLAGIEEFSSYITPEEVTAAFFAPFTGGRSLRTTDFAGSKKYYGEKIEPFVNMLSTKEGRQQMYLAMKQQLSADWKRGGTGTTALMLSMLSGGGVSATQLKALQKAGKLGDLGDVLSLGTSSIKDVSKHLYKPVRKAFKNVENKLVKNIVKRKGSKAGFNVKFTEDWDVFDYLKNKEGIAGVFEGLSELSSEFEAVKNRTSSITFGNLGRGRVGLTTKTKKAGESFSLFDFGFDLKSKLPFGEKAKNAWKATAYHEFGGHGVQGLLEDYIAAASKGDVPYNDVVVDMEKAVKRLQDRKNTAISEFKKGASTGQTFGRGYGQELGEFFSVGIEDYFMGYRQSIAAQAAQEFSSEARRLLSKVSDDIPKIGVGDSGIIKQRRLSFNMGYKLSKDSSPQDIADMFAYNILEGKSKKSPTAFAFWVGEQLKSKGDPLIFMKKLVEVRKIMIAAGKKAKKEGDIQGWADQLQLAQFPKEAMEALVGQGGSTASKRAVQEFLETGVLFKDVVSKKGNIMGRGEVGLMYRVGGGTQIKTQGTRFVQDVVTEPSGVFSKAQGRIFDNSKNLGDEFIESIIKPKLPENVTMAQRKQIINYVKDMRMQKKSLEQMKGNKNISSSMLEGKEQSFNSSVAMLQNYLADLITERKAAGGEVNGLSLDINSKAFKDWLKKLLFRQKFGAYAKKRSTGVTALMDLASRLGEKTFSIFSSEKAYTPGVDYLTENIERLQKHMQISGLTSRSINALFQGGKVLGERAGEIISSVLGKTIPQYRTGTSFVPTNQIAFLHKGEAVVPAEFNKGGKVQAVEQSLNNGSVAQGTFVVKLEKDTVKLENDVVKLDDSSMSSLENAIAGLTNSIDNRGVGANVNSEDMAALKESVLDIEGVLDNINDDITELKSEEKVVDVDALKADLLEDLDGSISVLSNKVSTLGNSLNELNTDISELKNDINSKEKVQGTDIVGVVSKVKNELLSELDTKFAGISNVVNVLQNTVVDLKHQVEIETREKLENIVSQLHALPI